MKKNKLIFSKKNKRNEPTDLSFKYSFFFNLKELKNLVKAKRDHLIS